MDYNSNSKKSKEESEDKTTDKVIEKVVVSEVIVRKKPLGRKIKDIFIEGELRNAARFVAADVLLPALRNLLVEASNRGIERVVYGESYRRTGYPPQYGSRTIYNSPINRDRGYSPQSSRPHVIPAQTVNRSQARRDGFEIILSSRAEAETVLERLTDILDQYDVASVADLHELVGVPASHVDNKWGWTVLNGVQIRQIREGFLLDLPAAENI